MESRTALLRRCCRKYSIALDTAATLFDDLPHLKIVLKASSETPGASPLLEIFLLKPEPRQVA
jgi:hypothetical protein